LQSNVSFTYPDVFTYLIYPQDYFQVVVRSTLLSARE